MIIYNSKFLRVNYLELQYLMHFYWSGYAAYMDGEGFYYESARFVRERIKRRADSLYLDWRNVEHLIDDQTFVWYERYVFPLIFSMHAHKLALLLNNPSHFNFPSQIRLKTGEIPVQIFSDPGDLMNWLQAGARRKDPGVDDHSHGSCGI